jgi:hypothetical protein
MLDLVPLAGPRRKATKIQFQTRSIGELLQHLPPQLRAEAFAAATVGSVISRLKGLREAVPSHALPPVANSAVS